MTPRTLSPGLRRPAHALTGPSLATSLLLVLAVAVGWGLLTRSTWVGACTVLLALPPLYWMPQELESAQLRFRRTLLIGGLMAAIHLFIEVMS